MKPLDRIKLTREYVRRFEQDGFLVMDRLLSHEEIDAFLAHEASRPETPDLGLRAHMVDPQWKHLATHPNVAGIAAQLLGGPSQVVQTMYLPKKAGKGAPGIALHQDTHYLPSEPNTLMACWIAMSDTDERNGGLCVVPGSHREELRTTHKSSPDDHHSWTQDYLMRDQAGKEWTQTFYSFEIDNLDPSTLQTLKVRKGGGVFFTGMTIHGSYLNRSDHDRLAFAVHYIREGSWVFRADVQDTMPTS